jgi:hypothetical protein
MRTKQAAGLLVGAAILIFGGAAAAEPKAIGRFGDWTAFVDNVDGKKICFIGASPKKAEGNYTARGQTYLLVTHRPAEKVVGEVSIAAGYTFKPNSEATADIDGKAFTLFTQGENAWARNAQADRDLVRAMRAGKQMVIKGTSSRGTATTDTYSLSGVSAALEAINKACGVG